MKKLLFIALSLYNGGAEKSLVNLLNELSKYEGYNIDLLLFRQEGPFLKQLPDSVTLIKTPKLLEELYSTKRKSKIISIYRIYATVVSRILEKDKKNAYALRWEKFYSKKIDRLSTIYDVAIAYMGNEIMYFLDEKVQAKKKIAWVHNDYRKAGLPKKYDAPHFKHMDAVVTISDECLQILNEEFPEICSKTYNIANITSSEVTRRKAEEFNPTEFNNKGNIILSVGRLDKQKGFDFAIKVASILKRRNLRFEWYIIGDGTLRPQLEMQISDLDVSDCFFLLGAKENPYPYIKNCTIIAQTSRFEGKSVVLDEAKILCKPIVVTNYPTVHDQIVDGKEGMIVSTNAEDIADGIQKMLEKEELRNGFSKYLEVHEYGNQDEIQKYIDLIEM